MSNTQDTARVGRCPVITLHPHAQESEATLVRQRYCSLKKKSAPTFFCGIAKGRCQWGCESNSLKCKLITVQTTVKGSILLWREVQTHSRVHIRFLEGLYMMEYCLLGVI